MHLGDKLPDFDQLYGYTDLASFDIPAYSPAARGVAGPAGAAAGRSDGARAPADTRRPHALEPRPRSHSPPPQPGYTRCCTAARSASATTPCYAAPSLDIYTYTYSNIDTAL